MISRKNWKRPGTKKWTQAQSPQRKHSSCLSKTSLHNLIGSILDKSLKIGRAMRPTPSHLEAGLERLFGSRTLTLTGLARATMANKTCHIRLPITEFAIIMTTWLPKSSRPHSRCPLASESALIMPTAKAFTAHLTSKLLQTTVTLITRVLNAFSNVESIHNCSRRKLILSGESPTQRASAPTG